MMTANEQLVANGASVLHGRLKTVGSESHAGTDTRRWGSKPDTAWLHVEDRALALVEQYARLLADVERENAILRGQVEVLTAALTPVKPKRLPTRHKVRALLERGEWMTNAYIAKALGISPTFARNALAELRLEGDRIDQRRALRGASSNDQEYRLSLE